MAARAPIGFDAACSPAAGLTRASTAPSHLSPQRAHLLPGDAMSAGQQRRRRRENGAPEHRRKRRRSWKKLLWVDRAYPDNYTDQATFLEQLQRNPRLQAYEFWPLVADTTIIVQQVCSVIIFVVAFVSIFQERVSHLTVVSCGSALTFLGWLLWDRWAAEEDAREDERIAAGLGPPLTRGGGGGSRRRAGSMRRRATLMQDAGVGPAGMEASAGSTAEKLDAVSDWLQASTAPGSSPAPACATTPTTPTISIGTAAAAAAAPAASTPTALGGAVPQPRRPEETVRTPLPAMIPELIPPPAPSRTHQRLATIKSGLLISSVLLGLSPILKSLTRSTSSDSIWAMCLWLLLTNIISFDYSSSGPSPNRPASLSTNAALMASTVLASRLPSTGQVFSLTALSIEVFGLFPVLRRYTRQRPRWHVVLTVLLVLAAGGGTGVVLGSAGDGGRGDAANCLLGMAVGAVVACLAMGGCSWWLIGLQKYKNEINGPWDAARPVIISRRYG